MDKTRRSFLKAMGTASIPMLVPMGYLPTDSKQQELENPVNQVNFISDGLFYTPTDYIHKLGEIAKQGNLAQDFYGKYGVTEALEMAFAQRTGKEKAIYLPSGTMANQLAISLLAHPKAKVLVPENSHVFRDEADAAQRIHSLRLVPLGANKDYFDVQDVKTAINEIKEKEVFVSDVGALVIENPVRRADGRYVPIEVLRDISTYCRSKGIGLHLDGARLDIAAAYSGVSLLEYAELFDTVYISLYKYLNACGGAILCGNTELIDRLPDMIKIHGGTQYQTWTNTAVALEALQGLEGKWAQIRNVEDEFIGQLSIMDEFEVAKIPNGTNIHTLSISDKVDLKLLATKLYQDHQIILGRADAKGLVKLFINESLLRQNPQTLITAFRKALEGAIKR